MGFSSIGQFGLAEFAADAPVVADVTLAWKPQWPDSGRRRAGKATALLVAAGLTYVAPALVDANIGWARPFSEPTRYNVLPRDQKQSVFYPDPTIQVSLDKWHTPFSVPAKRTLPGLARANNPQPTYLINLDAPKNHGWIPGFNEPRRTRELSRDNYPFTHSILYPAADVQSEHSWIPALNEPRRTRQLAISQHLTSPFLGTSATIVPRASPYQPLSEPRRTRQLSIAQHPSEFRVFDTLVVEPVYGWLPQLSTPMRRPQMEAFRANSSSTGAYLQQQPIAVMSWTQAFPRPQFSRRQLAQYKPSVQFVEKVADVVLPLQWFQPPLNQPRQNRVRNRRVLFNQAGFTGYLPSFTLNLTVVMNVTDPPDVGAFEITFHQPNWIEEDPAGDGWIEETATTDPNWIEEDAEDEPNWIEEPEA